MMKQQAKNRWIIGCVAGSVALVAGVWLMWWVTMPPPDYVRMRLARERDAFREVRRASAPAVEIGAIFSAFDGAAGTAAGSWPRFRGPRSDNIGRTETPLASQWPTGGPPVLWSVALGEGYAGPAVHGGRVYVLDYDRELGADLLRCFSLDDGSELWQRGYQVEIKRNHGMSRTVPAVSDDYVVTLGPKCHVMCVDAATGDFLWGKDLQREFGTEVPLWYTGQCPLIDDGIAVLAPGGSALLVGVDCATGEEAWRTPNPDAWKMSHSSIVPMLLGGRRMYVYAALGGLAGVAAEGVDRGTLLWKTTAWNKSVVAPSPVAVGDDRILVTAGYGAGSMLLKVTAAPEGFAVATLREWDRKVFACEQHTPIVYEGHLFTVMPKDAGPLREQLVCLSPDGTLKWSSGRDHRFGLGPFMMAGGRLLAMNDDGHLTLAAASTRAYEPLAEARILTGREAWAPFALAEGRLLARDFSKMVCLDMR